MRSLAMCVFGTAGLAIAATSLLLPARAQPSKCPADRTWLDQKDFDPSEPINKESECEFYKRSWQAFLHVTKTGDDNRPAFLNYATFRTLFLKQTAPNNNGRNLLALTLRTPEPASPVFDGGIDQALSSAVVDRNGNPIFYSIAIDPVFAEFIQTNQLDNINVVRGPSDPAIKDGAIEIKASWQILENPEAAKGFLTTQAILPGLKQVGDRVHADLSVPGHQVTVGLLGIHVVFKLTNHPEFIWATFEHIDAKRNFDLAPPAASLPPAADRNAIVSSSNDYILYQSNTTYDRSNQELAPMTLQANGKINEHSSIFRAYPWSQVADANGQPPSEDDDVAAVNSDALDLLIKNSDTVRSNYKLVGAVWLKRGADDFHVGKRIGQIDLIGEKGLSNMAIESLTQEDSPNCFSCHNPVRGAGMPSKAMNVSHLFELFSKSQVSMQK